jgi:hypothetical protein
MKIILKNAAILAVVTVLFCAPGSLRAQAMERFGAGFTFGVRGGLSVPNPSSVTVPYPAQNTKKPAFGIFADYNLSESFVIHAELLYLTQSQIYDLYLTDDQGNVIDVIETETSRMYVHVPILAKIRVVSKGWVTPIVFAGPAVSVAVRISTTPDIAAPDYTPEFKDVNLSFVIGGGLEAAVGRLLFSLDARYDLGFADLHSTGVEPKTNALMIMAGIGF